MNEIQKRKSESVERSKKSSEEDASRDILDRITDSVKGTTFVNRLYDEMSSVFSISGATLKREHVLLPAYKLRKAGLKTKEVTNFVDAFTETEAFAHCVKYSHPPTPKDLIDTYREHFRDGNPISKSEDDYREFRERRMKRHLKDESDERESTA